MTLEVHYHKVSAPQHQHCELSMMVISFHFIFVVLQYFVHKQ